jgi:hypothetical protein
MEYTGRSAYVYVFVYVCLFFGERRRGRTKRAWGGMGRAGGIRGELGREREKGVRAWRVSMTATAVKDTTTSI